MSLLPSLVVAVALTWASRTAFIALLPADRLPEPVVVALDATTPAVLAALAVVTLLDVGPATASTIGLGVPLGVAVLLAARRSNLAVVVLGAIAAGTAVGLLSP